MIADYHIHTSLCKHAEGTPVEYAKVAVARGLSEICFTDHAPTPHGYDPRNRMELDQFPEYMQMVKEAREGAPIEVLIGIEADYYEGCDDYLSNWLESHNFDLVIGSVHYIGGWGFDDPSQKEAWKRADVSSVWKDYFSLVARFARTGLPDAIAHLDLPKKFGYIPAENELVDSAGPALDAIKRAGIAIEINTGGLRKPVKEMYPSPLLLKMANEKEIPICFGSDAHAPDQVGADFDKALCLARECGYTTCVRYRGRNQETVPLPSQGPGQ